jgi:aminopeptidase N
MKLSDVSNGRLRKVEINKKKKTKTFHWAVVNPINNYGVNLNIGDYVQWEEVYQGEKGPLDLSYWVLRANESKARKQFKEVPRMMEAFEHWFGPYPFYEDGYKLVEAPYLGMEHQSSVTYGNHYMNGYLGTDLSKTGWGLKFDFIIVHESGHEWFANNVTHRDMADMWIHEGFTNYSESLFLDYHFGKEAGQEYVRGVRRNIEHLKPLIGPRDVNYQEYPGDVYYKGSNILNTLRAIVNNDDQWRGLLRGINAEFYHQTINSADLEKYMAEYLKMDLEGFFDQFLREANLPVLEYYYKDGKLQYRWDNTVMHFDMPVDLNFEDGDTVRIFPSADWKSKDLPKANFKVDPNYMIGTFESIR